jgi:hypothetical protein
MASHRKKRKAKTKRQPTDNNQADAKNHAPKSTFVKKDVPPTDSNKTYSTKQVRDALDYSTFGVGVLTLILLGIYTCINYGLYETTTAQLDEIRSQFSTSQRSYISLGDEAGKLAEFRDVKGSDKPIVVLHFFNSGGSVARHFNASIYASSVSLGNVGLQHPQPMQPHRHRFRLPVSDVLPRGAIVTTEGTIVTNVFGPTPDPAAFTKQFGWMASQPKGKIENADIPPKALKLDYLTETKWLVSRATLTDPDEGYTIQGDFEYCDIFGQYHCQKLAAHYLPPPIDAFIQSTKSTCLIEKVALSDIHLPDGTVEIAACEQSNEQEYVELKNLGK